MFQRVHCKLDWNVQQILSQTEEMIMSVEEVLQHVVQTGCPTQMNGIDCGLFAVMSFSIFWMVWQSILQYLPKNLLQDYARLYHLCWVMRRMQQDSVFPCQQAVISQNLSLDVIWKYSRHSLLEVPTLMKCIKIFVNDSDFGTTITTSGHGFIIHDLNQVSPNAPPTRGKQLIYQTMMKLHCCL